MILAADKGGPFEPGWWVSAGGEVPLSYRIDDAGPHVVRLSFTGGSASFEEWELTMNAVFRDPAFRPDSRFLSDRREGDVPSQGDIHRMIRFLKTHEARLARTRWALVARGAAAYGMSRMAQILASDLPLSVGVFTDPGEALDWLCREATNDTRDQ